MNNRADVESRTAVIVVIPVYNRQRLVLECLESVAAQTRRPDTVVVVDDGSTDGTAEVVRGWITARGEDGRFRIVEAPRRAGAAAARNRGFAAAGRGRFVAFLDSDDLWPSDFVARTRSMLERDPDAVAASTDIRRSANGQETGNRPLRCIEQKATRELFRGAGVGSATLLRAAAVHRCGGYDESLQTGHDAGLFLRVSLLGRWRHAPGAPIIKRVASGHGGEHGHIYEEYADHRRRWAQVYDDFARSHDLTHVLAPSASARLVARWWRHAGRDLQRRGRSREARDCFRRALAWRPRSPRTWCGLLGTYVPSFASGRRP